jgi:hypothetical protein
MCGGELSRRDVLAGAVGLGAAIVVAGKASVAEAAPAVGAVEVMPGLAIFPRSAWGADLPPVGRIRPEEPKFLLVHHTQSPNVYPAGGARTVLRSVYEFHTGPEKQWPDVCYQFFVDHDGGIWEGRAGALDGPVMADATAGSQGWAQLVCLIGDFTAGQPTPAARDALVRLLAWLSQRYSIDTAPGATASFTSRGSNKWPVGAAVTTPTIAGHRDMTYTECPGNAFYPDVRDRLQADVHAYRLAHPLPPIPLDPSGLIPARREGRRTIKPS